ncbi:sulfotransferase [Methylotuvimicrobium buryatense]|uniref:Sulfotransferase family protein n=1 Tax=Methylotuvimicrobium buryatense TaxID=95641 RepID=A0A4P9US10_METBY|nr:sulfotransferase [Methylotuvimicrobium buryatense]QCW84294.1 sulfotransferase family protein [Methylotuvimicrobium buryatense]
MEIVSPVAIGAIGGSGTRVVARLLMELGYYIGSDLNHANDNLLFTSKFKRLEILNMSHQTFSVLLDEFVSEMKTGCDLAGQSKWAWKEPNTHIVIDRLLRLLPKLHYIHVIRHGLDMAHSNNQNQPRLWGSFFLGGEPQEHIEPRYSLKYWCAVHRRIMNIASHPDFSHRILFIDYDELCHNPLVVIRRLCSFLKHDEKNIDTHELADLIQNPGSIGRWKKFGLDIFDAGDLAYLSEYYGCMS